MNLIGHGVREQDTALENQVLYRDLEALLSLYLSIVKCNTLNLFLPINLIIFK